MLEDRHCVLYAPELLIGKKLIEDNQNGTQTSSYDLPVSSVKWKRLAAALEETLKRNITKKCFYVEEYSVPKTKIFKVFSKTKSELHVMQSVYGDKPDMLTNASVMQFSVKKVTTQETNIEIYRLVPCIL